MSSFLYRLGSLLIGGLLLWALAPDFYWKWQAGKWPAAPAVITWAGAGRTAKHFTYEYELGGRKYKSKGSLSTFAPGGYSVGTALSIRYDPQKPARSFYIERLENSAWRAPSKLEDAFMLLISSLLLAFGLLGSRIEKLVPSFTSRGAIIVLSLLFLPFTPPGMGLVCFFLGGMFFLHAYNISPWGSTSMPGSEWIWFAGVGVLFYIFSGFLLRASYQFFRALRALKS